MDKEISGPLITGLSTTLAAVIAALPLYLQNRRLKRKHSYITTGLAVAYYYSFVTRVFDYLDDENSIVEDGSRNRIGNLENASLEIRFPTNLDESTIKKSLSYMKKTTQSGKIRRDDDENSLDIRFNLETSSQTSSIVITDLPSILSAASKYYQGSAKDLNFNYRKEWKSVSEKELLEFQKRIEHMVNVREFGDRVRFTKI